MASLAAALGADLEPAEVVLGVDLAAGLGADPEAALAVDLGADLEEVDSVPAGWMEAAVEVKQNTRYRSTDWAIKNYYFYSCTSNKLHVYIYKLYSLTIVYSLCTVWWISQDKPPPTKVGSEAQTEVWTRAHCPFELVENNGPHPLSIHVYSQLKVDYQLGGRSAKSGQSVGQPVSEKWTIIIMNQLKVDTQSV